MMVEKNISDIINEEYRGYAMYTIENRAIPSYIDGLKISGRKLVYAMINQFKGKKIKVAELGSSLPSHGYHHGESSAMGAAITLTADWNNNIPVFRGYGNFGSRLITDSAAPRYIYCDLNPEFKKYFVHNEVANASIDIDNPEPQQYLPLIPWVLVNGIEGIAVGFACKYLPHDPKEIIKACIKSADGKLKSDHVIPVKIPHFKGVIEYDVDNHKRVITKGVVERTARNKWVISELPYGYDRKKYFDVLTKMMETNIIRDFEDCCDESGFNFLIKLDNANDEECAKNPIEFFKLEKAVTENYTALDEEGKLVLFEHKTEIIDKFVKFRIKKVREYIDYQIDAVTKELHWLTSKLNFITDVIYGDIEIMKLKKIDLIELVVDRYSIDDSTAQRLVASPVYNMTEDQVGELNEKIDTLQKELVSLKMTNEKDLYIDLLKAI